jgi:hypothetical protein
MFLLADENAQARSNRRVNFETTISKSSIPREYVQQHSIQPKDITALARTDPMKQSAFSLDSSSLPKSIGQLSHVFVHQSFALVMTVAHSCIVHGSIVDVTNACDCVLWAGDLNFRLDMTHQDVIEQCKAKNYTKLLCKDEFRSEQKNGGKSSLT